MSSKAVRLSDLGPNERALVRALWRMAEAKANADTQRTSEHLRKAS